MGKKVLSLLPRESEKTFGEQAIDDEGPPVG
jgi:hypothetical protein